MEASLYRVEQFDCFNVFTREDTKQFYHIEINNSALFYKKLFEYFFSENFLLKYAENNSSVKFQPSNKNYVILFNEIKLFIDEKNQFKPLSELDAYLQQLMEDEGRLIDQDGKLGIYLDKIGKIGEYIFSCILSQYFNFTCIIPKLHLVTDYNMSVYGIDTLFYSNEKDLLLFGESKVSKNITNGINLINKSLNEYKKQIEDEFTLILSNRTLKNSLNVFTQKFGKIVEQCISIEKFIKEANIKNIGIPIFIAHGEEIDQDVIFEQLKKIKTTNFFDLNTEFYLITLPIVDKAAFTKEFTKFIKEKEDEYKRSV